MACHPQYKRLCRLIDDSLRPYTEPAKLSPLTKLNEKHLLITLSQVSNQIRSWDDDHELASDHEEMEQDSGDFHNCLFNIVSILCITTIQKRGILMRWTSIYSIWSSVILKEILISFLNVESKYVQHSTRNLLMFISNLVAESRSKWDGFVRSLCVCLEVGMSNIVSSSSIHFIVGTSDSDSDTLSFTMCIRERLANANWFMVAGLIQILRTLLKHLKQEGAGELLQMYMHCINSCLTNIPWELLNEINAAQTSKRRSLSMGIFHNGRVGSLSRFVFLGALLQFFCSLVNPSSFDETGHGTLNAHPVLNKIMSVIPMILHWCFCMREDDINVRNLQYLRHKSLMLMIRLSYQVHQESSAVVLLFQLVREYFEDLLHLSIFGRHTDLDECLEGSPFLLCFADKEDVHSMYNRHLQRQAIFLFLKCSVTLIGFSQGSDNKCSCATSNSCLKFEAQTGLYCCTKRKALLELSEWLQRYVPIETFVDCDMYLEKCGTFALSFVQLFMDEDDLLFEVLLHLSSLPFPVDQMVHNEKGKSFEEEKGNAIFLMSTILNPVRLFHLFLAELHYDHLVLLDYLISKDTGIQCLQYLLRCFRMVSKSWHIFVELPLCEIENSQYSCKKRKVSLDNCPGSDGRVEVSSLLGNVGRNSGVFNKESKRSNKFGGIVDMRKWAFENAKECLLSLKKSVENLHQKNLFLYNPAALLRSFTRFEELCLQEETVSLS